MASQKKINASTMTAKELITNMTPNQVQAAIRAGQILKKMAMDNGHTQEQVDKYENATWMKAGLIHIGKSSGVLHQPFVMCLEKNSIILMEHQEQQAEDCGPQIWGVAND